MHIEINLRIEINSLIFVDRFETDTIMINNVQMELLNATSELHSEDDLLSLKHFLVAFFAQRVDAGMDALWDSGKWNEQTLTDLSTAHSRTAYK